MRTLTVDTNVRRDAALTPDFVKSIKELGVLEPVVAHRKDDGAVHVLMPRVPSSPRVAVWRRLQSLGVAQLGDGLVGLPADARTKEHLEWIAADIEANAGTAAAWIGHPTNTNQERQIITAMQDERRKEYLTLAKDASDTVGLGDAARVRVAKRLQQQLRKIARRDYFPPAERATARTAVKALLRAEPATPTAAVTVTEEACQ